MIARASLAAPLIALLASADLAAQCGFEVDLIEDRFSTPDNRLGCAIATHGDLAVFGAKSNSAIKGMSGHGGLVEVYRHDGVEWKFEQRLTAGGAEFGAAVATDGARTAIGAPDTIGAGGTRANIFVFDGDVWQFEDSINAPSGSLFGQAIAIDGRWLAVGSPYDSPDPTVYVYERVAGSWVEVQQLTGAFTGSYGRTVSLSGDLLAIGDPDDGTGRVELFRRVGGTWSLEQTLTAGDPTLCRFGSDVAIDGGSVAITASCDGSVLFFERSGGSWAEVDRVDLPAPTQPAAAYPSVDLDGDVAVAGVSREVLLIKFAGFGTVYQMRREHGDWEFEKELFQTDPQPSAQTPFGIDVAVGLDVLVSDSEYLSTLPFPTSTGAVFVYPRSKITLRADDLTPIVGTELELTTCGGDPGDAVVLSLVDQTGGASIPFTQAFGFLDASGSWTVRPKLPASLVGTTLTFESIVMGDGGVLTSNRQVVRVVGSSLPYCHPGEYFFAFAGTPFTLDGTKSFSTSGGQIVRWDWAFSDGGTASGPTPSYTFATPGTKTVYLTVTDSRRAKSTCVTTLSVFP